MPFPIEKLWNLEAIHAEYADLISLQENLDLSISEHDLWMYTAFIEAYHPLLHRWLDAIDPIDTDLLAHAMIGTLQSLSATTDLKKLRQQAERFEFGSEYDKGIHTAFIAECIPRIINWLDLADNAESLAHEMALSIQSIAAQMKCKEADELAGPRRCYELKQNWLEKRLLPNADRANGSP